MDHGNLVPDRVAIGAVENWLDGHPKDAFVFDGFPRTVGQAEALHEVAGAAAPGCPLTAVLWLELPVDNDRGTGEPPGGLRRLRTELSGGLARRLPRAGLSRVRRSADRAARRRSDEARQADGTVPPEHTEPVMNYYRNARGCCGPSKRTGRQDEVFARIENALATNPVEAAFQADGPDSTSRVRARSRRCGRPGRQRARSSTKLGDFLRPGVLTRDVDQLRGGPDRGRRVQERIPRLPEVSREHLHFHQRAGGPRDRRGADGAVRRHREAGRGRVQGRLGGGHGERLFPSGSSRRRCSGCCR